MTDEEKEVVIEILIKQPHSVNAYGDPIRAVEKAMKWDTLKTETFVDDLVKRKLIVQKTSGFTELEPGQALPISQWWWERPESVTPS